MDRQLTTIERSFLDMSERIVMNPVVIARCRGPVDIAAVEAAIAKAVGRHEALQVKVVRREPQSFSGFGVPRAPLRVVERRGEAHWRTRVEEELNVPMDAERGPLIRFVLNLDPPTDLTDEAERRWELICTTDHVNADGRSGLFVLRDVLRLLADPERHLPPLPDRGCMDAHLPGQDRSSLLNAAWGWGRVPRHLRGLIADQLSVLPRMLAAYRDERGRLVGERPGDASEGRRHRPAIAFVHRQLSPAQTAALVRACRAHDNTVQPALTVACAHALAEVRGLYDPRSGRARVGCISPIDVRGQLTPPVGDHFGVFAWAPTSFHTMRPELDFWAEAARARAYLEVYRSRAALAGLRRVLDLQELLGDGLDGGGTPIHRDLDGKLVVSNLGRVDLPRSFGGARLESFGFFAMIPDIDFVLATSSLDALALDFCYSEAWASRVEVEAIADDVEATLARICETG